MSDTAAAMSSGKKKVKVRVERDEGSEDESWDSDDDDETIARIQRAHFAQTAAMNARRRAAPRPRPMSNKRKLEAMRSFQDFTKKLKQDTGIKIRSFAGNNILDVSDFSSENSASDSDGLSEEEFVVNPSAVEELNQENESYIDPETGDIVETKKTTISEKPKPPSPIPPSPPSPPSEPVKPDPVEEPKTLSITDIINDDDLDLDLTKNVEIAEVDQGDLCPEKGEELLDIKTENSQEFDESKVKVEDETPSTSKEEGENVTKEDEKKPETEDEKKHGSANALNVRRNIREVMDEKNLDASTLAAQRQESERLARVQEQQRIIREVQRQIAINRQNKIHQKTLSLLQGGSSILKKGGQKLNLPNTVLVKLPSGEIKKTVKPGSVDVSKITKPIPSGSSTSQKVMKPEQKSDKKEVVEIVDSSSGEESSSSSSDSDDCIMLSDSEVPASPEAADEDPGNSGLHVNDTYNIPDDQGRVLINIGHPESEEDIFLAPQIARVIKPHQIGGVRFLFDNIIESVERFSTSTGFGCILAHSMGLGKTLQIVSFSDIFLRHTTSKTVLCIMPINTLQNWVAEFNMWLPVDASTSPLALSGEVRPRNFPIYVLNDSHKTLQMRAKVVKDWSTTGGVLMIGYELYRLLSMKKDKKPRKKKKAELKAEAEREKAEKKKEDKKLENVNEDTQSSDVTTQSKLSDESKVDKDDADGDENKKDEKKEDNTHNDEDKKLLDEMYEALVRPGPDLVICDEGHRIKNSHSNISYALKQMRTKRRVVLTGYPLQNNLLEYWCMVDFVRPNYLGSKTEFCNMFERPIQNGQCIDSTPQDIRLMRYRAHVLHSLLVGFVQRRSHAVLQSTLPQKEEYVLLVRMTPLQRKLYQTFMDEVVRSTSVPNPLKAFAICCKIWNHPDVLYNFLRKRSEANAAIEEDLDLEELGGVTKAGRARNGKAQPRRAAKTRGASKKPAATIPPNSTGPMSRPDSNAYNPNGPYPPNSYRPDQPAGSYPPYPNYPNQPGFYPQNQGYNQNYDNSYYQQQQQQPPYSNSPYPPNQYPPPNNPEGQGYNQNYWGNGNYYDNSGYYNNQQYPNNQPPQDYRPNPPEGYNNPQQYPPGYNQPLNEQGYQGAPGPMYPNAPNPEGYAGQQRPPYQGAYPPSYPEYNANTPSGQYPNNQPGQEYPNQAYPAQQYPATAPYGPNPGPYNQYPNQPANYSGYPNDMPSNSNMGNGMPNELAIKSEPSSIYPPVDVKQENTEHPNSAPPHFNNPGFNNYNQPNTSGFPEQAPASNGNYSQFPNFPPHLETKPPMGSASSGSPVPTWPMTELKTEIDRIKNEEKAGVKSESDGEVKIADLDTKTIVKEDSKKDIKSERQKPSDSTKTDKDAKETGKSDGSESEEEVPKKGGRAKGKGKERKKSDKSKQKNKPKAKGRKDRKISKEKNNDDSESEESEKEEKMNREEELAMVKKAEELTYDWASELLKDYIPGIIENSAKMELFFYILNESIKMGDRILLFSQSLFTLNLIEDFLERNYIPGTNCLWERNTSYYRLDGSTHALEREKLINEFNANPHVYLFLVSTRAGSLGINLVGANRVIVFDASWNPCHDTQAVCRVYRYGQKKPCFVYRFVMDCCLEKKIYDRQINKQGMSDRVVDECNPDAVLSMKEITNLCFDNDEKEPEPKDLSENKDRYLDVLMQGILVHHGHFLTKEPFQHESLLVDRKEKKLSSAEKRLAQRGYELEKKAASAPKPTQAYRTVRAADGSLVQRPVASVRPMQHAARWIPADVWRRQGMTAQEMTLPLDVVIPTNSAEKTNIVLKAGQRVMVLKSPKGIYMQLESGKIIAIKTSFKGLAGQKGDNKDNPIGKKVLGRQTAANIPGSLKNNSAITITSKSGPRPGFQRITRPSLIGSNKIMRPLNPGQKLADLRNRLGEMRAYGNMRPKFPVQRVLRPSLPGSVSITKIPKDAKKNDSESSKANKMEVESEEDTQVLDSDDEDDENKEGKSKSEKEKESDEVNDSSDTSNKETQPTKTTPPETNNTKTINDTKSSNITQKEESVRKEEDTVPIVLTTDEKLPSEEALEDRERDELVTKTPEIPADLIQEANSMPSRDRMEKKINLKNYRHQRQISRPANESSLSQLERTASVLNKEAMPDFRRNLDDITQSYSPGSDERPTKSRKKKSPNKTEVAPESQNERQTASGSGMSHSVSSLLSASASSQKPRPEHSAPVPSVGQNPQSRLSNPTVMHHDGSVGMYPHIPQKPQAVPPMGLGAMMSAGTPTDMKSPGIPSIPSGAPMNPMAAPGYPPGNPTPDAYGQYPGYGMGYGAYPNTPYYGGYSAGYYPPYAESPAAPYAAPPAAPYAAPPAPAPAPDGYLPPNPQW